jgi:hypothetical protein
MARRRTQQPRSPETAAQHEAAQQDEAEISSEMGAQPDPESGALLVDAQTATRAGAVDTESVRENRRLRSIVHGKRTGKRDIHINVDDVLMKYDTILRIHSADSLYISVKRISGGSAMQQTVSGFPRNGRELYEAIRIVHGRHEEATYQVNFVDSNSKEYRGKGQIVMPETRDPSQQGQPMGYPPYGVPPPPPSGYAQPFQPQGASTPAQGQDIGGVLAGFKQLMEMMQAYQAGGPFPPQSAAPTAPGDVTAHIDQLRQMLDALQWQPGGARPNPRGAPAQPVMMNPQMAQMAAMMGMPPVQPPPGTMWVPGFGFVPIEQLMRAVGMGQSGGVSGPRGPFRGPFAGGAPDGGDPQQRGPSPFAPSYMRPAAPEPPRSAAEQFRESINLIRTAANAARDFQSLFPGQEPPEPGGGNDEDEASPVRIFDAGAAKIVVSKKDGSIRGWETGFANLGPVLKWAGEQLEIARSRQPQPPPRALPEGYVELTPGYRPPPGYVAVPEQPPPYGSSSPSLPPPPLSMPPPLGGFPAPARPAPVPRPVAVPAPAASTRRTWGPPTIPQ